MKKFLATLFCLISTVSSVNAYETFKAIDTKATIPCWASSFSDYTEVIGYSSLGHIFMKSPVESTYAVLHPFKKGAKSYGVFESTEEFEKQILQEESFQIFVLNLGHVKQIRERLGPLREEEVYIPSPYPFLGGDESIGSYSKGNIWVMLEIVGQFHGLCS